MDVSRAGGRVQREPGREGVCVRGLQVRKSELKRIAPNGKLLQKQISLRHSQHLHTTNETELDYAVLV